MARKKKIDGPQVIEHDVEDASTDPQEEVSTIEKTEEKKEPTIEDGVYTEYDVKLSTGVILPEVHVAVGENKRPPEFRRMMAQGFPDVAMQFLLSDQTTYLLRTIGWSEEMFKEDIAPIIKRGMEKAAE